MYYLTLSRCPTHGVEAITLDDESGGIRLTEGKCCGRWDTVKRWPMSAVALRGASEECAEAAAREDKAHG